MGRSPRNSPQKKEEPQGQDTQSVPVADQKTKSSRSSPRKGNGAVIKLKMPEKEAPSAIKPIKLTLKLGKPAVQPEPTKETARITPKLTLSLRRPSKEDPSLKEEQLDVVSDDLPKKRGRKPKLQKTGSVDSASPETVIDVGEERRGPGRRRKAESAPPSFANSKASLAASASSLPSAATPVPPPKPTYQVPVYSEEDRITRQVVNEIIQDRVTMLQTHHELWDEPCESINSLMEALWPFYEQLAVTEVTHSGLYRQAAHGSKLDDLNQRHQLEYEQILNKFNGLCFAEKMKPRETELVLLEHRLCLEEEKFLYTKLKNDYYSNYANMGGRKPAS